MSKVAERIYATLLNYLEKYKLLYQHQFGFKISHSTYVAVSFPVDTTVNALDEGDSVLALYLEPAKAFDTVDHSIIVSKLECCDQPVLYFIIPICYLLQCDIWGRGAEQYVKRLHLLQK